MDALKYLKLDLKLMKGYYKIYVMLPLFLVIFSVMNSASFALNYLFFFVLILSVSPFSLEGTEGCQKLYYSLPAKIESMVLGRYLFLFSGIGIIVLLDIIAGIFFMAAGKINDTEILILFMSIFFGSIIGFSQYPVFYKFGFEKGRISSLLLYMIPSMLVFLLPSIISDALPGVNAGSILSFMTGNMVLLIIAGIFFLSVAAYVSYRISCTICKKKEI